MKKPSPVSSERTGTPGVDIFKIAGQARQFRKRLMKSTPEQMRDPKIKIPLSYFVRVLADLDLSPHDLQVREAD